MPTASKHAPALPVAAHLAVPIRQDEPEQPFEEQDDDPPAPWFEQRPNLGRLVFFALHVIGISAFVLLSLQRFYYLSSEFKEIMCVVAFVILTGIFLACSGYLCFVYGSSDLLLIGIGINILEKWRSLPRISSIETRKMHRKAPMWRSIQGEMFKQTTRNAEPYEKKDVFMDAYRQEPHLENGFKVTELIEKEPSRWENDQYDWRKFIISARMGDTGAHRAALALRMAHSVPLPAVINCDVNSTALNVARVSASAELKQQWHLDNQQIGYFVSFFQPGPNPAPIEVSDRTDLAIVLHLKMLMDDNGDGFSGSRKFADDWLFGEMVCSFGQHLQDPLVWGTVDGEPEKYWNILSRTDARMTAYRDRPEQKRVMAATPEDVLNMLKSQDDLFRTNPTQLNVLPRKCSLLQTSFGIGVPSMDIPIQIPTSYDRPVAGLKQATRKDFAAFSPQ